MGKKNDPLDSAENAINKLAQTADDIGSQIAVIKAELNHDIELTRAITIGLTQTRGITRVEDAVKVYREVWYHIQPEGGISPTGR